MLESWKRQTMFSWKQSPAPILLIILLITATSNAVTEGRNDKIKNKLLDETQFSNPNSFDYNFEDDIRKPADTNDIYDELVPYLPTFVLHKNGKNVGRTSVPIITRKMPAWSTPPPKQKYIEPYKPFSPRPLQGFEQRPGLTGLAALIAKPVNQNRFSQRFQQQQQRIQTPLRTASVAPPQTSLSRSTTTTRRTTTTRISTAKLQTPIPGLRHLDIRPSPQPLSTVIKPTISSHNNILNRINNSSTRNAATNILDVSPTIRSDNNDHKNQQPRPFPKLVGYPLRLSSAERSSSDVAVIRPQPLERFGGGNGNTNSNAVIRSRSIQARVPAKPLIIHTGAGPYLGPTFNCKVLTPKNDGRPSATTDKTCALSAPGISADGRCRCTFDVSDRDSNGCALGFLFTCIPK